MNYYRFFFAALLFFCSSATAQAQDWVQTWIKGQGNFYAIQDAFNRDQEPVKLHSFFQRFRIKGKKEEDEKEGSWLHYKRWEWFMEPRVYPSGDISLPTQNYERFNEYLQQNPAARLQASGARSQQSFNWSFVGPAGAPNGGGAGRINGVHVDPVNTDVIWACAAAGGLWKTTDGGATWTNNNDFLSVIGCSDVLIDPTNTQVMYLATGDCDHGDTYSIGVLKSTDGGISWNPTGLTWVPSQNKRIYKMIMDPGNSSTIYIATNSGVFKTTDGGISWALKSSSQAYDIEFQPGNPNTIYICSTKFLRSTNAGNTWTQVSAGLPTSIQVTRLAIAVTPANPNMVYVLAGAANSYGFYGLYRSTNDGNSFVMQSNSPNLLGWSASGSDNDGQAWYTLSIAVSKTDPNTVITGGVNIWQSQDGGVNWNLNAHWYGGGGAPYVHADIHDLIYAPGSGNVIYAGCDGGVFYTTDNGASWNDISGNMGIAQIYRLGLSGYTSSNLITGHQDNGTNLRTGSGYDFVLGGDGMDCFIDWSDDQVMYGELYYGDFHRSTNGGQNWQTITNGMSGSGAWVTPWTQDPVDPNTLYSGYSQVFKSTDRGDNWTQLGTVPSSGYIVDVKAAPSNTQVIYAASAAVLVRSSDGGQNWTNITSGLPVSQGQITRFAINPADENKVWVTFSGYQATAKVFFTTNGGQNWSNWSSGLPNLPVNCAVAVPGTSSDAVFVGCDVGVYYRDNNSNGWQPYFSALPNTVVSDLEIFQPTWTLRAATFGRGVWECPIDTSLLAPLADFSASPVMACTGQSISFTDLSTFGPGSWSWNFPGGTPSASSMQNPVVVYNTPGVYPVTLTVSDVNGSNTRTRTAYVTVGAIQQPPLVEGFTSSIYLPAGWTGVNNNPQSVFWDRSINVGHNSTESVYINNYDNSLNGATDELRTMQLNLTGYSAATLSFDVAYCRYNSTRSDTLEALVSTDCGQSFSQVYLKGGSTLATKSDQITPFVPNNNQWRTETVSLNSFAGNSSLIVAFRNHGRHGQFLYIDNVNIAGATNAAPVAAFNNAPPSVCVNTPVNFTDISSAAPSSWNWTFNGAQTVSSSQQNPGGISWATPGTYTVSLIAGNSFGSDTVSQSITVFPAPAADAGSDTAVCAAAYLQLLASGGVSYSWAPPSAVSNATAANPALTSNVSVTTTVTVTDNNGCSAVDSVHVTILPAPQFSIASPANICNGDTAQLLCSDTTLTYNWTPQPTLLLVSGDTAWVSPLSSTPYVVTATDSNGCSAVMTRTVSTFPPVGAPTISVNGNVLTSSATSGNQWYMNGVAIPGETGQTYTVTQQGIYSVVVTTINGCSSQASLAVIVNVPSNAADLFNLTVSPNPGTGYFVVDMNLLRSGEYSIEVSNVLGQVVYKTALGTVSGKTSQAIDLSANGKGSYFLRIYSAENELIRKILVY